MSLLLPTPPPYDPLEWVRKPLAERGRMVCEAWALQGYGTPPLIYVVHVLKIALYVGAWVGFCSCSPELGGPGSIARWWLSPIAFEKAILWSMLFEGLGLGCGFGPLTGRYFPPIGGVLYFLRPGTTKLAVFPRLPVLGGMRRTRLDVALYVALLALVVRALVAPAPGAEHLVPIAVIVPVLGLADRTIFLALRAEHYWTTIVCFAAAGDWIAGAKAVQLALWFWAGFSKLNHHFPSVVCVMTSNSPVLRLRLAAAADVPPVPRRPAAVAARGGDGPRRHRARARRADHPLAVAGRRVADPRHRAHARAARFITSNVPMGVPIEWNVMVVYGAFALFWAHPGVTVSGLGSPAVAVFLVVMLVGAPLLGNLAPGAALVPARDAVLRRQLGVQRVAVPRRQPPQARAADQGRAVGPRAAGRGSTTGRPRWACWARSWGSGSCTCTAARCRS